MIARLTVIIAPMTWIKNHDNITLALVRVAG
jgi:hypothetical protein